MYDAISSFGAFAFGLGLIIYAIWKVFDVIWSGRIHRAEERRHAEWYAKKYRGG